MSGAAYATTESTSGAVGIAPIGHRLPAETRLGRVRLQVADLERSSAWYERVLGLHLLSHADGTARLAAGGEATPLIELQERRDARPVAPRGRLGLYHFALLLPDRPSLGAFLRHATIQGERVGASDHAVSEALYLTDPDGLGIEVYADRPRTDWHVHGGEIQMDTRPLDAAALARAAKSITWAGMPKGTVLGHLHLHVGDLAEADAFYHQALGLDRRVWSYPGALFLSAGGYHHHLGLNTWAPGAAPASDEDARLLDWELDLPTEGDVATAAQSLHEAGHQVHHEGAAVHVSDPWGTRLRLAHRTMKT